MTQSLARAFVDSGSAAHFEDGDLETPTLADADRWYPIFQVQGDSTTAYGAGYGIDDDRTNSQGWSDLDLQNAGGTAIDARLRYRVYRDSSKDDLIAQGPTFGTSPLRSAVSSGRKDKILIPARWSKVAGNDGYLTVEAQPKASSTGDVVDAGNSSTDYGMSYGEIPVSK